MKEISIIELSKILNASVERQESAIEYRVSNVSIDSRTIKKGDCFFAIPGENHDGHDFLADAFANGAICAVVSDNFKIRNLKSEIKNKIFLKVDDTIKSLGVLAAWYRKESNFKVVAITGSVGKTTTRQILYNILSRHFKTHQPIKNFNNHIGLPLTLLAAPYDCQIVVLELGTNHPGEIEYLTKIASPHIALVTTVAPAHLEGFGDLETLTNEKLSISKGLDSNGILILNGDCSQLVNLAKKQNKKFLTFGLSTHCNYRLENFQSDGFASRFEISNAQIVLPLPGLGNAYNALAAWAVASQFKINPSDFADALKSFKPVSMRSEILIIGSLTIINDCYNANPASMENAIDILNTLAANQNRRAVFICGDMAELGTQTENLHINLGRQIAQSNINLLLTVGNLALIAADSAKNQKPSLKTHSFLTVEQLCDNLSKLISDSDIILVKGSRINKLEKTVEKLKLLFS